MKKKNRLKTFFAPPLLAAAGLAAGLLAPAARAAPVVARWSDLFVESVGVNVHWSYPNQYQSEYSALKTKLGESGIRHVRDGTTSWAFTRAVDLYNTYGIRTTMLTGRRFSGPWPQRLDGNQIDAELADIKTRALDATAAIEGPNEYDISKPPSEPDWVATLRSYQQALYTKAKADPLLRSKPVLGPSVTTHEAAANLGNLAAWMDAGNGHFYKSNRHPGTTGWGGTFTFPPYGGGAYGSLDYNLAATRQMCGGKTIQSTECGYQNSQTGDYLSETGEAKYLPRTFAEFFRRNIARSFKYEFVNEWEPSTTDPEKNYGLLRSDLGEKPTFKALKNLLNLLRDNTWDRQNRRWTASPFTPGALDYTLTGGPSSFRQLLLQKSDGVFFLLVWNEVSSFNPTTKADINNASVSATLNLVTPIRSAAVYTLDNAGNMTSASAPISNRRISLQVPDTLTVVKLTPPARPGTAGNAPAAVR